MRRMDWNRIKHYMGMVVTAPGKELYGACAKLRGCQELVRGGLLVMVLALLAALLWLLRGDLGVMLLCGSFIAVGCFYLYFKLLSKAEVVIGFVERLSRPFALAFARHTRAVYGAGARRASSAAGAAASPGGAAAASAGAGGNGQSAGRTNGASGSGQSAERANEAGGSGQSAGRANGAGGSGQSAGRTNGAGGSGQSAGRASGANGAGSSRRSTGRANGASGSRRSATGQSDARREGGQRRNAALEEAQLIYAVRMPYTAEEIRQKRNLLLKKYHPDNAGGSEEMCKKVNECYRILSRYAS